MSQFTKRITVRLDDGLLQKLDLLCTKHQLTRSEMLRRVLEVAQ